MSDRLRLRPAVVIVCLCAITCLAGLGRSAVTDADEAFYAEAAREMVETGDYLTPRYNYENRFQKPVLYYWMVAAAYQAAGPSSGAARFPAALAGMGLAAIAWWCGARWFDAQTGAIAGIVIATSLGFVSIARLALPDPPLAFFIGLAIAAGVRGLLDPGSPRLWTVALAGAAAGAAFLTKGPVGLVLPAFVIGGAVVAERRWDVFRPWPIVVACAAAAAVGLPWYVQMTRVHGAAYLDSFFVGDNLERFATDRFNDPRPLWFYLPIVLAGLLPWSACLALWWRSAWRLFTRRARASIAATRVAIWVLLPLLLFTASIGKQPRYILPILPAMAIAIAVPIRESMRRLDARSPERLYRACGVIAGLVIAVLGAVLVALPPEPIGVPPAVLLAGGLVSVAAGLAASGASWWRPRLLVPLVAGATLVLVLALQFGLLSTAGPETVQQVAARLRQESRPETAWTTYNVLVRNLVFYVGRRQAGPFDEAALVEWLRSNPDALAVLKAQDLERIGPRVGRPLYRLAEWQYFNVAAIRASLLIDRNPSRRTRTVVLVATRPRAAP